MGTPGSFLGLGTPGSLLGLGTPERRFGLGTPGSLWGWARRREELSLKPNNPTPKVGNSKKTTWNNQVSSVLKAPPVTRGGKGLSTLQLGMCTLQGLGFSGGRGVGFRVPTCISEHAGSTEPKLRLLGGSPGGFRVYRLLDPSRRRAPEAEPSAPNPKP